MSRVLLPPAGVHRGDMAKWLCRRGSTLISEWSQLGSVFGLWTPTSLVPQSVTTGTDWENDDTRNPGGAGRDMGEVVGSPSVVAGEGNATYNASFSGTAGFRSGIYTGADLTALQAMQTGAIYALVKFSTFATGEKTVFAASSQFASRYMLFGANTSGKPYVALVGPNVNTGTETWVGSTTLSTGVWYVLGWRQPDGTSNMVMSVNGVAEATVTYNTTTGGTQGDWIGDVTGNPSNKVTGVSAGVRVEPDAGSPGFYLTGEAMEIVLFSNGTNPNDKKASAFLHAKWGV